MGVSAILKGKLVYLDTAPLIYFIEKHPAYYTVVKDIFELHSDGAFIFTTSVLTLSEVLSQPANKKNGVILAEYENILTNSDNVNIVDFTIKEARRTSILRSVYKISRPDAIQLATAIELNVDIFLTNDHALRKVKELEVLTLRDLS
jgi:predicted nucleic acid-binding protein